MLKRQIRCPLLRKSKINKTKTMKPKIVICTVPDKRKAQAVKDCLTGSVTPMHPSSILQRHKAAWCFLNAGSASLL